MPVLDRLYDHWTPTANEQITPRSCVDLHGENLKVGNPEDTAQGIFLIDSKGEEVRADRISLNQPKKVIFSIPEM